MNDASSGKRAELTDGAVYFSNRSYQAERSLEKTYTDAMDKLAALRVAQQGRHPRSTS